MNSAAVFKILDVVMVDRKKRQGDKRQGDGSLVSPLSHVNEKGDKRTVPLSPKYAYNVALNVV